MPNHCLHKLHTKPKHMPTSVQTKASPPPSRPEAAWQAVHAAAAHAREPATKPKERLRQAVHVATRNALEPWVRRGAHGTPERERRQGPAVRHRQAAPLAALVRTCGPARAKRTLPALAHAPLP